MGFLQVFYTNLSRTLLYLAFLLSVILVLAQATDGTSDKSFPWIILLILVEGWDKLGIVVLIAVLGASIVDYWRNK